jgi:Ca-activated chloride channel family protein
MNRIARILLFLAALICCLSPATARADGFIIIYPPGPGPVPPQPHPRPWVPPGHFTFAPLEVTYHRVSVTINDQVATTTVDQEFYNPNPQRLEGTYMFPLPEGAHIDKFAMDVNGKLTDAELLDAQKARAIYEEIVRKVKDPALLEYAGRDAFKARIFPIEPNSRKQIKISYTQLLKSDTGLIEYTYPLNTEKFSSRPLGDVSVKVSVECKDQIKALYSPSHNVEVKRDGDHRATVGWEQRNVRPDTDFKLILSRKKDPVGVDLLTYRNSSDDGYFLLLASPGMDVGDKKLQQRDVCFVLDTSGSMSENGGKKMEQAKKALSFCLQNLNDGDRFEIVRFSTEAEPFFKKLTPVTKENVAKATEYVQSLKPIGGTAIEDALEKALKADRPPVDGSKGDRPYVIIFLTDGQPTIGETNEDSLVAKVKAANTAATHIFSFGIGNDVNTHLLDRVASETKSFSQYVGPEEDLEVKVSNFYTKISQPVLANVSVDFTGGDGVRTSQLYPGTIPDLFKGEMLVIFGRYGGKGAAAVKVSGTLNGERQTFAQDVTFADRDTKNAFIPQLWATRRVGWLLDQIRLNGEKQELREEVVRLAREHGIVTPYTAYLIMEDERRRDVPVTLRNFREFEGDAAASPMARARYNSAKDEALNLDQRTGAGAVANAQDIDALKSSANQESVRQQGQSLAKTGMGGYGGAAAGRPYAAGPAAPAQAGGAATTSPADAADGYRVAQNYAQQSRVVNGRAFYQNATTWTDSTAQQRKDLKRQEIAFNSDAYFHLLAKHPEAAAWLSLGEQVDVVLEDTLYVIR